MKANELSIGNYFIVGKSNPLMVEGIFKDYVWSNGTDFSFALDVENQIKPIPLTEEWLLKFGFDKPANTWIGNVFHLTELGDFPLNWCVGMNKNNAIIIKKLKYVHQLQNLYFTLTGKELVCTT